MITYNIATITIALSAPFALPSWKSFETKAPSESDLTIEVMPEVHQRYGLEPFTLHTEETIGFRRGAEVMFTDAAWRHVRILAPIHTEHWQSFLIQAFYAHALSRRMIQIHSSLIRFHGEGLMFIGPSGIGKTTQAELWQTYRNSDIINGDMVFIQQTTDRFIGWGTPWHGSSPYCMNTNVPIKAVIVLQQDSRNQIRRLHGFEKVTALSRNIIFPQWLPDGTQKCLDILNPFVQYIPVYELSCRPDEDAIQMTEDVIFS